MKTNSKHYTVITLAIGSVFLSSFGYWYIYGIVIKQAENYSKSLQEIALVDTKKQQIKDIAKMHEDTLKARERLSTFVLTDDKLINFIEFVESIGNRSSTDTTISSIKNDDLSSAEKGTFGHLKARIDIKGSWTNIMRALVLIENLPYSLSLNNIDLNFNKADKNPQWNVRLDIEVLTIK